MRHGPSVDPITRVAKQYKEKTTTKLTKKKKQQLSWQHNNNKGHGTCWQSDRKQEQPQLEMSGKVEGLEPLSHLSN